ncbi:MAG TPA: response regulator [Planctomycetota bacterium]|nr:response regulator [Planctomycetota bacterium]
MAERKAKSNGKRVLAIDDDGLARDIYRSILEEQGFEVVAAADGRSGIDLFRKQKFDCVILDIYMPGMSGLDVIEELDPDTSKVPIIAVSGGSGKGDPPLHLASTLGAVRSFRKDFEHADLVKAVQELTGIA